MYLPVYAHMLHVCSDPLLTLTLVEEVELEPGLPLLHPRRRRWRQSPADPHTAVKKHATHTHTHMHALLRVDTSIFAWANPPVLWLPLRAAATAVFLPDLSCCLICHLHSAPVWASLMDRGISCLCLVLRAGLSCWIAKLCKNTTGKHVMTQTGILPQTAAPLCGPVCVCVCMWVISSPLVCYYCYWTT